MCYRYQNIYDCLVEDISKKQQSTELFVASAILPIQLPCILYLIIFKFTSHEAISFSPAQEGAHCCTTPLHDRGRYLYVTATLFFPTIYLCVFGKCLWMDIHFSTKHCIKYLILKNNNNKKIYAPLFIYPFLLFPFPNYFHIGHFHTQLPSLLFLWFGGCSMEVFTVFSPSSPKSMPKLGAPFCIHATIQSLK